MPTPLSTLQVLLPQVDPDRLSAFLDLMAPATVYVAASDALDLNIARARPEYRCDGVADEVQINAAIVAINAIGGGKVELSEGTFLDAAAIVLLDNVTLEGQGFISTYIKCETNSIDVIQVHGADVSNKIVGVTVRDLQLRSALATSDGLSIRYSNKNNFENLKIFGFAGIGLHIQGSHDDQFRNIFVTLCGKLSTTLPSVKLENLADQNVNNENFLQLHLEQWQYLGIDIGADVGAFVAHNNRFTNVKMHGDETLHVPAIVCAGDYNVFVSVTVEMLSTTFSADGIKLTSTAQGNVFKGILFAQYIRTLFDIDGVKNIIDGVTQFNTHTNGFDVDGNANTITNFQLHNASGYGIDIAGNENQVGFGYIAAVTGKGIVISGNNNHLSSIPLNTVAADGVEISGHENELHGVSPLWCGNSSGNALTVTGDENHIFGGKFNGSGDKTIDFASGADNNRVIGAQVPAAITDSGSGNVLLCNHGDTPTTVTDIDSLLTELAALGIIVDGS